LQILWSTTHSSKKILISRARTNLCVISLLSFSSYFLVDSVKLKPRNTLFGYSITRPFSLLVLNLKDKHFHLSQSAKEHLASLEGECYVISVSGNPLVGKSSLLNLFLSFFAYYNNDALQASQGQVPYQDVYTVGDGKKSTTEGIDMYCISINHKNYIFLDVEGDNDPNRKETGVWIYSNLITTAVGASHVHMYSYNGLPQETFFTYFESINNLTKQNNLHPEFTTKHVFLKRNSPISSQEELILELDEYKEYFEDRLSNEELNYDVYMLSKPPQHIIRRREKTSCIAATGFICEECQTDIFMQIFLGIYNELNSNLKAIPAYKSGTEVIAILDRIMQINVQELPFFLDEGHISSIRAAKFNREQQRIQNGLMEVEQYQGDRSLSEQIQQLIFDHPSLAEMDLFNSFEQTFTKLTIKISQIAYIIPELSRFVEEYLLDDSSSILDNGEKKVLMQTYVIPFDHLTKEILASLKDYEKIIDDVCQNLLAIKDEIKQNLAEYMTATKNAKVKSAAVAGNLVASGVMGFLAREAAVKALAGFLVGGGAIGAALTIYTFVQAKKKWDEAKKKNEDMVDLKKITGINSVKEAEAEMNKVEDFISGLVKNLEENNKTLKEVCHEEKNRNFHLIDKVQEVIDKKISNMPVELDDRVKLIQCMKVAENNLKRFKQSI